ncbi:MAG: hypothetical protein R3Y11_08000 [Pseudomonadota bacterium]
MSKTLKSHNQKHAFWTSLYGKKESRTIPLGLDWFVARMTLLRADRPSANSLLATADKVLAQEEIWASLSGQAMQERLHALHVQFRLNKDDEGTVIDALAAVREAAWRVRNQRPYRTQVAGALGMLSGCIIEMSTGEGKTLTAVLAAVLQGWRGLGCHVVTSNDYLATRDAEEMAPIYRYCGMTVGSIAQADPREKRLEAYACDVTYLTSKDVTADFLRDHIALGRKGTYTHCLVEALEGKAMPDIVQRRLACAIVDEADSVLCDGGSTPLIISASTSRTAEECFLKASSVADSLKIGRDYKTNPMYREIQLTDAGRAIANDIADNNADIFSGRNRTHELILQALEARHFFHPSVQYVIDDQKIVIIDESTGRPMPDHEWRDGMHQAVAAKEGLPIQSPKSTLAQTTFQEFFLKYPKLSGMTGTAWEARGEFLQFFKLFVVPIPTWRQSLRHEIHRAMYVTKANKIDAIVREVAEKHAEKRPVLVGTRSIEDSEMVSRALDDAGIEHRTLNAVQLSQEADIIAQAGQKGKVTVATNMAGRGTDIHLGKGVAELGGLHVILTELHASSRVDRQLLGRCARQGDPGTTTTIVSMDDVLYRFVPKYGRSLFIMLYKVKATRPLFWLLSHLLQKYGDKRALRSRRRMVQSSRNMEDLTSYTGKRYY